MSVLQSYVCHLTFLLGLQQMHTLYAHTRPA